MPRKRERGVTLHAVECGSSVRTVRPVLRPIDRSLTRPTRAHQGLAVPRKPFQPAVSVVRGRFHTGFARRIRVRESDEGIHQGTPPQVGRRRVQLAGRARARTCNRLGKAAV